MRRRKRCSRTPACASSRRAPRWSEAFLNLGSPCGSPDGKLCRCKGERGHCAMVRGAPWRRHDRMKKRKRLPCSPCSVPTGFIRCSPALRSARSEEHTSELQSLMRISYAVFCLKKKNEQNQVTQI